MEKKKKIIYKFIASASSIALVSVFFATNASSKKNNLAKEKLVYYDNSIISYIKSATSQLPLTLKIDKYQNLQNQVYIKEKLRKTFLNLSSTSFFGNDNSLKQNLIKTIKNNQIIDLLDWSMPVTIEETYKNTNKSNVIPRSNIYSIGIKIFGSNKTIYFNLLAYLDVESSNNNLKQNINLEVENIANNIFKNNSPTDWKNLLANISFKAFYGYGKKLNASEKIMKKEKLKNLIKSKLIRSFSEQMKKSSFDSWVYDGAKNNYVENLSINNLLSGFDFDVTPVIVNKQRKYQISISDNSKISFQYFDVNNQAHSLKDYVFKDHGLASNLTLYINESPSSFISTQWAKVLRNAKQGLNLSAAATIESALTKLYKLVNKNLITGLNNNFHDFNLKATISIKNKNKKYINKSIDLNNCTLTDFINFFKAVNPTNNKAGAVLKNNSIEIPNLKIQFIEKVINPINKSWLRPATIWRTSRDPWAIKLNNFRDIKLKDIKVKNLTQRQNLTLDYQDATDVFDVSYVENNTKQKVVSSVPANQVLIQKNIFTNSDSILFYKRVGDKLNVWYTNNQKKLISKQILLPDADLNKKYVVKQNDNSLFVLAKNTNGLCDLKHIRFNKNKISTSQVDDSNSWITTFIAKKAKIVSAFKQGYYQNNIINIDKTFGYSLILEKNGAKRYPLFIRQSKATNNIDTLNIGGMAGMGPGGTGHKTWLHNKNATSFDFESSFLYEYNSRNYGARTYISDNVVEGGTDKRIVNQLPSDRNFYFIFDDKTNTILYAHFSNANFSPNKSSGKNGINTKFIGMVVAKKSKVLLIQERKGFINVQFTNLTPRILGVSPSKNDGKSDIFMFYNHERIYLFRDISNSNITKNRSKLLAFHLEGKTYFVSKYNIKIYEGHIFENGFNSKGLPIAYFSKKITKVDSGLYRNEYDPISQRWIEHEVKSNFNGKKIMFKEKHNFTKKLSSSSTGGEFYHSYMVHTQKTTSGNLSNLLLFNRDLNNHIKFIGLSDTVKTNLNQLPTGKILVTDKYLVTIIQKGTLISINKVLSTPYVDTQGEKSVLYSNIEHGKFYYYIYNLATQTKRKIESSGFDHEITNPEFTHKRGSIYIEGMVNKKFVVMITGFKAKDIEKHIIDGMTDDEKGFIWHTESAGKYYHLFDIINKIDVYLYDISKNGYFGPMFKTYKLNLNHTKKEFFWGFTTHKTQAYYYEWVGKYEENSGTGLLGHKLTRYKIKSWNRAKTAFLAYDETNKIWYIFNAKNGEKTPLLAKLANNNISDKINVYNFEFKNSNDYSLSFKDKINSKYFLVDKKSKLEKIYPIIFNDSSKESFIYSEDNANGTKEYYIHDISNDIDLKIMSNSNVEKFLAVPLKNKDDYSVFLILKTGKFVGIVKKPNVNQKVENYTILKDASNAILISKLDSNNNIYYYIFDKNTNTLKKIRFSNGKIKTEKVDFHYVSNNNFRLGLIYKNNIAIISDFNKSTYNKIAALDENKNGLIYKTYNSNTKKYKYIFYDFDPKQNRAWISKGFNSFIGKMSADLTVLNFNINLAAKEMNLQFIDLQAGKYYKMVNKTKTEYIINQMSKTGNAFIYHEAKDPNKYYIHDIKNNTDTLIKPSVFNKKINTSVYFDYDSTTKEFVWNFAYDNNSKAGHLTRKNSKINFAYAYAKTWTADKKQAILYTLDSSGSGYYWLAKLETNGNISDKSDAKSSINLYNTSFYGKPIKVLGSKLTFDKNKNTFVWNFIYNKSNSIWRLYAIYGKKKSDVKHKECIINQMSKTGNAFIYHEVKDPNKYYIYDIKNNTDTLIKPSVFNKKINTSVYFDYDSTTKEFVWNFAYDNNSKAGHLTRKNSKINFAYAYAKTWTADKKQAILYTLDSSGSGYYWLAKLETNGNISDKSDVKSSINLYNTSFYGKPINVLLGSKLTFYKNKNTFVWNFTYIKSDSILRLYTIDGKRSKNVRYKKKIINYVDKWSADRSAYIYHSQRVVNGKTPYYIRDILTGKDIKIKLPGFLAGKTNKRFGSFEYDPLSKKFILNFEYSGFSSTGVSDTKVLAIISNPGAQQQLEIKDIIARSKSGDQLIYSHKNSSNYYIYDIKTNKKIMVNKTMTGDAKILHFEYSDEKSFKIFYSQTANKQIYKVLNNNERVYLGQVIYDNGKGKALVLRDSLHKITNSVGTHILDTKTWNLIPIKKYDGSKVREFIDVNYFDYKDKNNFNLIYGLKTNYYQLTNKMNSKSLYLGYLYKKSNDGVWLRDNNRSAANKYYNLILDLKTGQWKRLAKNSIKENIDAYKFEYQNMNNFTLWGKVPSSNNLVRFVGNASGIVKTDFGKIIMENKDKMILYKEINSQKVFYIYDKNTNTTKILNAYTILNKCYLVFENNIYKFEQTTKSLKQINILVKLHLGKKILFKDNGEGYFIDGRSKKIYALSSKRTHLNEIISSDSSKINYYGNLETIWIQNNILTFSFVETKNNKTNLLVKEWHLGNGYIRNDETLDVVFIKRLAANKDNDYFHLFRKIDTSNPNMNQNFWINQITGKVIWEGGAQPNDVRTIAKIVYKNESTFEVIFVREAGSGPNYKGVRKFKNNFNSSKFLYELNKSTQFKVIGSKNSRRIKVKDTNGNSHNYSV